MKPLTSSGRELYSCTLSADSCNYRSRLKKGPGHIQSAQRDNLTNLFARCCSCWLCLVLPATHHCYSLSWLISPLNHKSVLVSVYLTLYFIYIPYIYTHTHKKGASTSAEPVLWNTRLTFAEINGLVFFNCRWQVLAYKKRMFRKQCVTLLITYFDKGCTNL